VTAIEWTDQTWNPVRGCSRVSAGCVHCYAERIAARFCRGGAGVGRGGPFGGFAKSTPDGPRWTGRVELIPEKLEQPLHWKRPRRVFVNSMSDLFHEKLDGDDIGKVFAVMAQAERHTFQVLTKRPQRMLDFVNLWTGSYITGRVLPNVWLGVSVEDQATADERIPLLLQTPAAVRFVSYEPALGPVDLRVYLGLVTLYRVPFWIIIGGESGPGARPFDLAWAQSVIEQCKAAGVACFVKQLGSHPVRKCSDLSHPNCVDQVPLVSAKGGDPSEWSADLRVREFPR
jgi:protein gp37